MGRDASRQGGGATLDGLVRMMRDGRITRRGFLVRAAAALGSAAAAEGVLARAPRAQEAPDFVVAQPGDVGRLDPHMSTSALDIAVSFNLHDTLTWRRADGRLHPALATAWTLTDPRTWEFRLRAGVTFHTGDPCTAADVKFSIERTYDPGVRTLVSTVFTTIDRIEVAAPERLLVHTRQPDPLLPARLSYLGGQIISKRYVEDVGPEALAAKPIGTGPVRFVDWIKNDRLVVDRVPDHWGGAIAPRRVAFRPIPETGPRVAALLKGEADIVTALPPDHVERVARHPTTRVEEVPYAGLCLLVVDSRRPPLDDARVKQALSLALDRESLVRDLWRGRGLVPNGPIPRGDRHYDASLPPLRFDPALARRRLREAGYGNEPIVLEATTGRVINEKEMSEAAVLMWRDVGLNVRLEMIEASVVMQRARERSFKGLRWAAPGSPLGDPDGMLWRLLGPGGIHDAWRHARFDELGEAAHESVDEGFRARAYREMTAILLEHLPWIPVLQPIDSYGVQRTVDWTAYPLGQIDLRRFNLSRRPA